MPSPPAEPRGYRHRDRRGLTFAVAAVLLAAADTYVVVAVLPSIMNGVGLDVTHLQRATPIISGFLLGYTVVLPLLGRLADVWGRTPVFTACLAGFALGSLLTATAHTLSILVTGRALQGLGGGGLVPVTLSMVAARWPVETRGLPLGVVGAVQELGSVLGPLYGAVVVSLSSWRTIFWINVPLAVLLGAGYLSARPGTDAGSARPPVDGDGGATAGRRDVAGPVLLVVGVAVVALALAAPASLADGVTTGRVYVPVVGGATWSQLTTPIAFVGAGLVVIGLVWETVAPFSTRPVLPLRRLPQAGRQVDGLGAVLLAGVLACVVILFSTQDAQRQVVASGAPVLAPLGLVLTIAFVVRQRRARHPLIPPGLLGPRPAWGALVVNLVIGAGLMAALVDIPLFARITVDPGSQVDAALVLVRFLVAVPIGAVAGGLLCRRPAWGPWVAATGVLAATVAFAAMARWGLEALATPLRIGGTSLGVGASDGELAVCGLGFGLAIAPVNAAVLGAVPARAHGLASSLVVVARTVGMLAGLSALTAIGLHRFYRAEAHIGSPLTLCPTHPAQCPVYDQATTAALLTELHTVFVGAAVCTGAAALLAVALLRQGRGSSMLVTPAPPGRPAPGDGAGQLDAVPGTTAPGVTG